MINAQQVHTVFKVLHKRLNRVLWMLLRQRGVRCGFTGLRATSEHKAQLPATGRLRRPVGGRPPRGAASESERGGSHYRTELPRHELVLAVAVQLALGLAARRGVEDEAEDALAELAADLVDGDEAGLHVTRVLAGL